MDKQKKQKYIKRAAIIVGIIALIVVIVTLISSPLVKYAIEKYDEQYTGRRITVGHAYVNLFTGYIYLGNLKLYEDDSDSIFFSSGSASANVAMLKLPAKKLEISSVKLKKPAVVIKQYKDSFNFSDLIERFKPESKPEKPPALKLSIKNISIKDGAVHYIEKNTPINYAIKNMELRSPGKRHDSDSVRVSFALQPAEGTGDIRGTVGFNIKSLRYSLELHVKQFDLDLIGQYLDDLANFGTFRAVLDADISSTGVADKPESMTSSGGITISNLHLGKNKNDDYLALDRVRIVISEISPEKLVFDYDSIVVHKPYVKYELYGNTDNLQAMFGKEGENVRNAAGGGAPFNLIIELARQLKQLSKNFFKSNYNISHLAVHDARIEFNDYSQGEKFALQLNPVNLWADSIARTRSNVTATMNGRLKPYGKIEAKLNLDPGEKGDFKLNYDLSGIPLAMFNPYVLTLAPYPLDRGTLRFKGNWNVENSVANSINHLIVVDPRTGRKVDKKDAGGLPLPVLLWFVREHGNVIDYEIPITGNLKDPKFNVWDVVTDLLRNIIVKPPTTPYRMEVKNTEREIEKMLTLKWEMRQNKIEPHQEKFLKEMAGFLRKNPDAKITVSPKFYAIKEQEHILLFETKKKYYISTHGKSGFSEDDSLKVARLSVQDSGFVRYVNARVKDKLVFSIQEKSARIVPARTVNNLADQLQKERARSFMNFFREKGVEKQINITSSANVVPYNGFSYYEINYNGDYPPQLLEAFDKMNDLNNREPRRDYKKERKKVKK